MDCNQSLVPLIFIHDVERFLWWGRMRSGAGLSGRGAKMVSAVATSVVPKVTLIVGGSFWQPGTMRCAGRLTIRGLCLRAADVEICGDEWGVGGDDAGGRVRVKQVELDEAELKKRADETKRDV